MANIRKGSKTYCGLVKAKEAMLASVTIFNSPLITFKTEAAILLMVSAWTYLLQVECDCQGVETRQLDAAKKRRKYKRDIQGNYMRLGLKDMVPLCGRVLSEAAKENILFVNDLRNAIQHSVATEVDSYIAPKLQANILNFRKAMLLVSDGSIDLADSMSLSLQFLEMTFNQKTTLLTAEKLPKQLHSFILEFESDLSADVLGSSEYEARVKMTVVNKERGGDLYGLEILHPGDKPPEGTTTIFAKEIEKQKYLPGEIVKQMKAEGWTRFSMTKHTELWKAHDARNPAKGYGWWVANSQWYWYQKWIDEIVRPYCEANDLK